MTLDGVFAGGVMLALGVLLGQWVTERNEVRAKAQRDEQDGRENDLGGIIAQQAGRIGELEAYIRDHSEASAEELGYE